MGRVVEIKGGGVKGGGGGCHLRNDHNHVPQVRVTECTIGEALVSMDILEANLLQV